MNQSIMLLIWIGCGLLLLNILMSVSMRINRKLDFPDLKLRIKMWWGMLFIYALATLINPNVSLISLAFLCFFALQEYFSLIKTRRNDRRVFIWAYLSIPIHFYWIYLGWYGMFIVFIPIYVFLFIPMSRIFVGGTTGFLRSVSSTQWGVMLMVFGLSHLAYFPKISAEYGSKLALYLVLMTQFNDVVQYLVSRAAKKKVVLPTANPNLTWIGFAVSLVLTSALSVFVSPYLTPMSLYYAIGAGALISFAGFFGTANISAVKRDLQVEDSSKEIAPKDSVLSKIDSMTYTAPLFFHYIYYFYF